jgi:predicted nucleic acid-binding protein
MSGKTFVDTNILLYAYDVHAGEKHATANAVLAELWRTGAGALSQQVLHEFYANATRKLAKTLDRQEVRRIVHDYFSWCVPPSLEDVTVAFQLEDDARISFWDAMIIAAAARANADRLLTEDLNHNQRIAGVMVVNPFA